MAIINVIKRVIKKLPFRFTKNQQYDYLTKKIIKKHCNKRSNCVDVGAHKGEILDLFYKYSPEGYHFAFEPVPGLYNDLLKKYKGFENSKICDIALSCKEGVTTFNYVISNPAYSGIKKRKYDRSHEKDTIINVKTNLLDHIIPPDISIDLIKIDVEGGEMDVLEGAANILTGNNLVIIFEFGIGGSDLYGTTPQKMFQFFQSKNYRISLLNSFIKNKPALNLKEFEDQFYCKKNYYFVAYKE